MRVSALSVTAVCGQTVSRISCFVTTWPWRSRSRTRRSKAFGSRGTVCPPRSTRKPAVSTWTSSKVYSDKGSPGPRQMIGPYHSSRNTAAKPSPVRTGKHPSPVTTPHIRLPNFSAKGRRTCEASGRAGSWWRCGSGHVHSRSRHDGREHGPPHPGPRRRPSAPRRARDRERHGARTHSCWIPGPRPAWSRRTWRASWRCRTWARPSRRRRRPWAPPRLVQATLTLGGVQREGDVISAALGAVRGMDPAIRGIVGQDLLRLGNWWLDYRRRRAAGGCGGRARRRGPGRAPLRSLAWRPPRHRHAAPRPPSPAARARLRGLLGGDVRRSITAASESAGRRSGDHPRRPGDRAAGFGRAAPRGPLRDPALRGRHPRRTRPNAWRTGFSRPRCSKASTSTTARARSSSTRGGHGCPRSPDHRAEAFVAA